MIRIMTFPSKLAALIGSYLIGPIIAVAAYLYAISMAAIEWFFL
jgi:hypothetical protein